MIDVTKPVVTQIPTATPEPAAPATATSKPTVTTPAAPNTPFDVVEYVKDKVKKEPRLVWLSNENHIVAGAHIFTIADNDNWANTASISTDGLQALSDNPQAQMAIMDVRFQQVLDALFGRGSVV